jgi:hypothetical protein
MVVRRWGIVITLDSRLVLMIAVAPSEVSRGVGGGAAGTPPWSRVTDGRQVVVRQGSEATGCRLNYE